MTYTVRPATLEDLDTITPICYQFWQESPNYSQRPMDIYKVRKHFAALIDGAGCLFLVSKDDGTIVGGFAGGIVTEWQSNSRMAHDWCMFVLPEYRGSRAAVLLLDAFLFWAKSMGANWVQCGTATGIDCERTVKFYEHFGFTKTGTFLEMAI